MKRILYLSLTLLLTACLPDLLNTPRPTTVPTQTAAVVTARPSTTGPAAPTEQPPSTPARLATDLPQPTPTVSSAAIDPAAYTWRAVVEGLSQPVDLTHAGDGSGRLFIVEQTGRIQIAQEGRLLARPFLDVRGLITTDGMEQGLLGLAFHPRYAENGYFYVHYSDRRGDTVLARYQVAAEDANRADPASATILLRVDQPYPNHNGGQLAFGPDGYLYLGLGDGGSGGDPDGNGQRLGTVLGKLLRMDVNNDAGYVIPADNPLVSVSGARPEIWAYGLRNPWRFSFDRATGDLYIADVGQNEFEEINYQPATSRGGENYGWNFMEGFHTFEGAAPAGLTAPILEYSHNEGGCSVTGGYVYRGAALPEIHGLYFYGDYCSGHIWAAQFADDGWQTERFANTDYNISAFGEDEAGELYLLDHGNGVVYALVGDGG
jgi:glucose/arabinose dehydrogenase